MDLIAELRLIVHELEARRVRYALCGGLAVAAHGAPRATKDIDVIVAASDLPAVHEAAKAAGYPFAGSPFRFRSTGITVQRYTKLIDGIPLILDVLVADEQLEPTLARARDLAIEGGHVRVVRVSDLLAMKVNAGRPQDLADIDRLKDVHDDP